MAIAWVLRDRRVTSALIGARSVAQLDDSLDALTHLDFSAEELSRIDEHATEGGIDLWRSQVRHQACTLRRVADAGLKLEGSCHCGAVRFACESHTPQPYQRCYCSICRKTAGGGGFAINMHGGQCLDEDRRIQTSARMRCIVRSSSEGEISLAERSFCGRCGSPLWLWDPRWPELIHPIASAIDSGAAGAGRIRPISSSGRRPPGSSPRHRAAGPPVRRLPGPIDRGLAPDAETLGSIEPRRSLSARLRPNVAKPCRSTPA